MKLANLVNLPILNLKAQQLRTAARYAMGRAYVSFWWPSFWWWWVAAAVLTWRANRCTRAIQKIRAQLRDEADAISAGHRSRRSRAYREGRSREHRPDSGTPS